MLAMKGQNSIRVAVTKAFFTNFYLCSTPEDIPHSALEWMGTEQRDQVNRLGAPFVLAERIEDGAAFYGIPQYGAMQVCQKWMDNEWQAILVRMNTLQLVGGKA